MKYSKRKPFMRVSEASALLDSGRITPVDLVEMAIEATDAQENKINAVFGIDRGLSLFHPRCQFH